MRREIPLGTKHRRGSIAAIEERSYAELRITPAKPIGPEKAVRLSSQIIDCCRLVARRKSARQTNRALAQLVLSARSS